MVFVLRRQGDDNLTLIIGFVLLTIAGFFFGLGLIVGGMFVIWQTSKAIGKGMADFETEKEMNI